MFDLANYFASVNNSRRKGTMLHIKSSLSSDEETASTTSVSSDSTPGSSDDSRSYIKKAKVQRKRKDDRNRSSPPLSNDSSSNEDQGQEEHEEEEAAIHYPPKIAFQIFELLELKRRCKGLYRRHQEYRRSQVIMANHQVINDFESYEIDGELFV
jgi:hypothetical protein